MLDSHYRSSYQRWCVDPFLPWLKNIHPSVLTQIGCLIGISVCPFLAYGYPKMAFCALLLSGFLDTLDGSLARYLKLSSSKGAALDIVCDRAVEFAIVLGFYLADPSRALPVIGMLGGILICVTTFLVVGIFTPNDSRKSFFYSAGLMERTEAFIFFALLILLPTLFVPLAWLFTLLTVGTGLVRLSQFLKASVKHEEM